MKKVFLILIAMFLCSGCATIINGSSQDVSFASKPEGATVKTGDGVSCNTPCKLTLSRKRDHVVNISKESHEQQTVTIQHTMSGAVAGNILAGGLVGWGVDALSGGQYKLIPETVSVELKPTIAQNVLPLEKLRAAGELKEKGLLTEDEFNKMKSQIISDMRQ